MCAGGLYTGVNKRSILLIVGKKLGLNSHNFACIKLSSDCMVLNEGRTRSLLRKPTALKLNI